MLDSMAHRKDMKDFRERKRYLKEGNTTVFAVKKRYVMNCTDIWYVWCVMCMDV